MATVTLRNSRVVGDYLKPYFIAELNTSHFGAIDVAKQMIDAAVSAGCDCVKFQSWSKSSLYSETFYRANRIAERMVSKFSLSNADLKLLSQYAQSVGIDFASTPYSINEAQFLVEHCDAPFVKIASMELNNHRYLADLAGLGVPLILSTGMGTYDEVKRAVQLIESAGNSNVIVLHCASVYPAPPEVIQLRNIVGLRDILPHYPIGYSDHSLGHEIAVASIALGACVIEKHFTLDKSRIGMDNQMATDQNEMQQLIEACKLVHSACGDTARILSSEELAQLPKMRRSVCSARRLIVGEILSLEDLTAKRPGDGIPPDRINELVGKRVVRDIDEDCLIQWEDVM